MEDQPITLTLRTPDDVVAATVVLTGFVPDESLTVIGLMDGDSMTVRTDLPTTREGWQVALSTMRRPLEQGDLLVILPVVWTDDVWGYDLDEAAQWVSRIATVKTVPLIVTNGTEWRTGMFHGVLDLADREETAALADRNRDHLVQMVAPYDERITAVAGLPMTEDNRTWLGSLRPIIQRRTDARRLLGLLVSNSEAVDLMSERVREGDRRRWVTMMVDLLCRTPDEHVDVVAGLAAWTAWNAGNGALAWVMLDRITGPVTGLAERVETALLIGERP